MKKLGLNDILETQRCILRIPNESDAEEVWNLITKDTTQYMNWEKSNTSEQQKQRIQEMRVSVEKGISWQAFLSLKDGTILGMLGAPRINTETKTGEIGYWLGESFQGKGYITEGVISLVEYIYQNTDWENVIIRVNPLNTKSCKVAERSGFKLDGILRKNSLLKGEYEDIALYSFTKEDYLSKK